jgi:NAD(P)-dependent dehydrogenase (short-subunit alcohol dehydrogenase family)
MFVIRKFVGYTGAAAGIGAAIAIAMSSQTGLAAAPANGVQEEPAASQLTLSAACTAAIDAIKADFRADASEDNAERQAARTDPTAAEAPGEDAGEVANLKALFSAARTACAPAATTPATSPAFTKFTPSAQCTAAIAALKAAWMQGRPTTQSQWQNLQALGQAVRSACGWSWSGER